MRLFLVQLLVQLALLRMFVAMVLNILLDVLCCFGKDDNYGFGSCVSNSRERFVSFLKLVKFGPNCNIYLFYTGFVSLFTLLVISLFVIQLQNLLPLLRISCNNDC